MSRRRVSVRDLGEADCQGWLQRRKEGRSFLGSKWKRYWFVLNRSFLYWYINRTADKAEGFINLCGFTIQQAKQSRRKYAMTATHPQVVTIVMAAESVAEMNKWMNKLSKAAESYDVINIDDCYSEDSDHGGDECESTEQEMRESLSFTETLFSVTSEHTSGDAAVGGTLNRNRGRATSGHENLSWLDLHRPALQRSDLHRPNIQRPDPQRLDLQRADSQRPDPQRLDLHRADPQRPDPQRLDLQRADPQRPDPQRLDFQRADPQRPDPQRLDLQRADFQRLEHHRPNVSMLDSESEEGSPPMVHIVETTEDEEAGNETPHDEMESLYMNLKASSLSLMGQSSQRDFRTSFIRRCKNDKVNEKLHLLRILRSTLKAKESELKAMEQILSDPALSPPTYRKWKLTNLNLLQAIGQHNQTAGGTAELTSPEQLND